MVFKEMLEKEKKKSHISTIKITEVSYDALRAFINYMYTVETYLDEQMAVDLLVMSEKYQVIHLKNHCDKFLVAKLSPEKSLTAYVFAHLNNAKILLDAALTQVTKNMENVIKSEEYKEMKKRYPRLVVEIHEAYIMKQVQTKVARQIYSLKGLPSPTEQQIKETKFHFTKIFEGENLDVIYS